MTEPSDNRAVLAAGPARLLHKLAGPFVIGLVFLGLTGWTWRKWPHPLVDFGVQLYIPWQLSEGRALYRDIAYFHGPFSQYFNAGLFHVLGVSLDTLIFANLLLLAALTALVYAYFAQACDRFTAAVVCIVMLCVFGFGQYVPVGNYNFVCPYLHESTHGLMLALLMLFLLSRVPGSLSLNAPLAGACFGLVFLTKIEIFVAAATGAAAAWWLLCWKLPRSALMKGVLAFCAGCGAVLAGCFGLLLSQMAPHVAGQGMCGNWNYVADASVAGQSLYRAGMGLDEPLRNVALAIWMALGMGGVVAAALGVSRWVVAHPGEAETACIGGASVTLAAVWLLPFSWLEVGRALPIVAVASLGWHACVCTRRALSETGFESSFALGLWSLFAFALLGKMMLNARLYHYGFTLALPATLLLVATLVHTLPQALHCPKLPFRAIALVVIASAVGSYLYRSNLFYSAKTFPLGTGSDEIITFSPELDPTGPILAETMQELRAQSTSATLAMIPDGILINYLLRWPNPTPYVSYAPYNLHFYGEGATLEALQRQPPDFVVRAGRDMSELGFEPFGVDERYGKQILQWIEETYQPLKAMGASPFDKDRFGVVVFQRKAR